MKVLSRLLIVLSLIGLNCASQPKPSDLAATIERELRSQYLIAYQSTNPGSEGFRPIEVKVKRPGAQVTTVAGYYP